MSLLRRNQREIIPGVYGWLESPRSDDVVLDCLVVSGWVFSNDAPVTAITATLVGHRDSIQHGLRRDDVKAAYPTAADSGHSGFFAFLEIHNPASGPVHLDLSARLADGRLVRLFSRRLAANSAPTGARRLLLQARSGLVRVLKGRPMVTPAAPADPGAADLSASSSHLALRSFLMDGVSLRYAAHPAPVVSVVVVLWNRAELTLRCLRALCEQSEQPVEIVIVDNQSTDDTPRLLARIVGATIVRNGSNLGFTVAANLGARAARGEFLLFLNNDAELMPGAVARLLDTIAASPSIGAVGGKLVFPDGRLQEAGAIIWSDGSCDAYGRNGDPAAGEFNFQRDVDYCSGAFLLTRRALFHRVGGFDERYQPAYYEDVDYCVRLWSAGHRVVYQPNAVAIHVEFASSSSRDVALRLQQERRPVFAALHRRWLASQHTRDDGVLAARLRRRGRRSVLVVDDAWPDPRLGSGFPRAAALLRALVELDYLVTFYPMCGAAGASRSSRDLAEIEIIDRCGLAHLRSFLQSRRDFDVVVVSRPHNLQYVKAAIGCSLVELGAPVIYDAEAVYALREIARRQVAAAPSSPDEEQSLVAGELRLARGCTAVLTVNETERRRFLDAGTPNVFVLGHALSPTPTETDFDSRRGLLFVGALGSDSPNEDAILFLVDSVLPAMAHVARERVALTIAGAHISERVKALACHNITVLSDVVDLTPLYAAARVFVAPTRYSAGIPLKLQEAAAHGLPIVCTPQLAEQLGWQSGRDVMTGASAIEIAQTIARVYGERPLWLLLRDAAIRRVAESCSPAAFRATLRDALEVCVAGRPAADPAPAPPSPVAE